MLLVYKLYLRLATARSGIFPGLTVGRIVEWLELNFPTVSQNRVSTGRPKTTKKTSLVQALDDLRTDGSGLGGVDFVGDGFVYNTAFREFSARCRCYEMEGAAKFKTAFVYLKIQEACLPKMHK